MTSLRKSKSEYFYNAYNDMKNSVPHSNKVRDIYTTKEQNSYLKKSSKIAPAPIKSEFMKVVVGGKKSRKRRNKKSKSNNLKRKSKSNKTFRYF